LLCHHRVLRIVVVGETIRDSPAQDNGLITFGVRGATPRAADWVRLRRVGRGSE
jgi:hypothetical protein